MNKKEAREEIAIVRNYAQKQSSKLYEVGGWNTISNKVYKLIIPRIISDVYDKAFPESRRRPDVTDIAFLYGILINYANTEEQNEYYGAAWVSTEKIAQLMRISRNRISKLSNILESNGLIKTVDFYEGVIRRKLYFPIQITAVSEDGYVINEDGERIKPSLEVYKALLPKTKPKKQQNKSN